MTKLQIFWIVFVTLILLAIAKMLLVTVFLIYLITCIFEIFDGNSGQFLPTQYNLINYINDFLKKNL